MKNMVCVKNNYFKSILSLVITILCIASSSFAQLSQPYRYERKHKNSEDYFHIISIEEKGIVLFRERDKYKNNNKIWEIILLDTTLQEKKIVELEVKERYKLVGYEANATHVYLLFRTGETTKNDFELVTVNIDGGEEERHTIKSELDFKLTHFTLATQSFILGGYVNREPAIIMYNLVTKNIKVVPGFFQKDTELVDLRVNQNNTFNVVLIDRSGREDKTLLFKTFDSTGELLLEDMVPIDYGKSLLTGITSELEREDLIIIGNWGERNSKSSIGFYSLTIDPFQDQKINFIPFGALTHYLDYLKPKRASKIIASTKADMAAGRNPKFASLVTPYKIHEHKDGFLLLAEIQSTVTSSSPAYGSQYSNNPYYYNPYGFNPYGLGYYPGSSRIYRPFPYSSSGNQNNDVKIHETVLILFDEKGNVAWDQSMVLDELKVESPEQVSDFMISNDTITLVYKKESELKFKRVVKSESSAKEQTEKLKTNDPFDEIRSEKDFDGFVKHWYGNSFFVWGYQTIRNINSEDRVRDVFYINKVVVK
ncbi:MAG TPA: hypothetical protein PLJ60_09810 [Chryseolinea sp.]|nr:hypothetical protein [Chryseolinea sp.]HPM30618.1 hypothetical protein [Chryseolinea sp.]